MISMMWECVYNKDELRTYLFKDDIFKRPWKDQLVNISSHGKWVYLDETCGTRVSECNADI